MPDAELTRLGRPGRNAGVLGQFVSRVEREDETASEAEHHDRAGRVGLVIDELGGGHAGGVETEAIAVEGERAVEIADRECDDVDVRFHRFPWSLSRSPTVAKGRLVLTEEMRRAEICIEA